MREIPCPETDFRKMWADPEVRNHEMAERYGVSQATLARWARDLKLGKRKTGGKPRNTEKSPKILIDGEWVMRNGVRVWVTND